MLLCIDVVCLLYLLWRLPHVPQFIPSIVDGQLDIAVMNILIRVFWCTFMHISIGYLGLLGHRLSIYPCVADNCHTVFKVVMAH